MTCSSVSLKDEERAVGGYHDIIGWIWLISVYVWIFYYIGEKASYSSRMMIHCDYPNNYALLDLTETYFYEQSIAPVRNRAVRNVCNVQVTESEQKLELRS